MINQADVNVKNAFTNDVTINLKRLLKDETVDLQDTIPQGELKNVNLADTDVRLELTLPEEIDLRDCLLKIKTDVDINTICSRTNHSWTIRIIPNDLPPDTPTTVNVTVGQDEPD